MGIHTIGGDKTDKIFEEIMSALNLMKNNLYVQEAQENISKANPTYKHDQLGFIYPSSANTRLA